MLKIYGSMLCKDCVACVRDLKNANVAFEFLDFSESLLHLKAFLTMRDTDAAFADVKSAGAIGIPCIVDEAGSVSLDWQRYLHK